MSNAIMKATLIGDICTKGPERRTLREDLAEELAALECEAVTPLESGAHDENVLSLRAEVELLRKKIAMEERLLIELGEECLK